MKYDDMTDGLSSIRKLYFTIDAESKNPNDNIYSVHNERIYFVNIATFLTKLRHEEDDYYSYDLREPARKIIHPNKLRRTNKTIVNTDDWRNIPYYNNQQEAQSSIEQDNREMAEHINNMQIEMQTPPTRNNQIPPEIQRQMQYQMQQLQQPQPNMSAAQVFSPEYARQIGAKPASIPSARIRLGGVYR
jgi:hypothetical protein